MTDTPWTTAEPDRIDIADELHNGPSEGGLSSRFPTHELMPGRVLRRRPPMTSLPGCEGQPVATW
jgi:hypothetical protein